jgi:ATP-dependent Clp endopeptidase proteolytic subunit ClpP
VEGATGGQLDVVSRLLKDRILLLGTEVNDEVANVLVAQLLYLANDDPEKEITLYINSPGGSVSAGLAIFDTMKFIPCDVQTVCFGMAASMGAFLLGAGTPGKRKSLPNARVMIHQPLGGARGQAADIEIQAKEILFTKALLNKYIADYTGQPVEKIEEDCDRDFFMTPYEAKDYGIIDEGTFVWLGGCRCIVFVPYRLLKRNSRTGGHAHVLSRPRSDQDQKEPHPAAGNAQLKILKRPVTMPRLLLQYSCMFVLVLPWKNVHQIYSLHAKFSLCLFVVSESYLSSGARPGSTGLS